MLKPPPPTPPSFVVAAEQTNTLTNSTLWIGFICLCVDESYFCIVVSCQNNFCGIRIRRGRALSRNRHTVFHRRASWSPRGQGAALVLEPRVGAVGCKSTRHQACSSILWYPAPGCPSLVACGSVCVCVGGGRSSPGGAPLALLDRVWWVARGLCLPRATPRSRH